MTAACWTGPDTGHLQAYHDPSDEPTAEPLDPSFFDFDNGDPLGKEQLKGAHAPQRPARGAHAEHRAPHRAHLRGSHKAASAAAGAGAMRDTDRKVLYPQDGWGNGVCFAGAARRLYMYRI